MHSIKKFVFVLVALMGFMPINAQSVLNKTISSLPNYVNKKDIKKAENIIASINMDSLALQPDSTRFDYHYYAAAIDEIKGLDTEAKAEHLKIAKLYLETLPSLGIGTYPYPEVCYALGSVYQALNREDDALKAWEDGISKCLTVFGSFDAEQKDNFFSMIEGLADIYEKRGQKEYATRLRSAKPQVDTQSFDYASELVGKALNIINAQKAGDALKMLNEAEVLLPRTNELNYQYMFVPLYANKSTAFAALGNLQETQKSLAQMRKYQEQLGKKDWFAFYISQINSCAVYFATRDDYKSAFYLIHFSKNEVYNEGLPEDSATTKLERNIKTMFDAKMKADSLEVLFNKEKNTHKWATVGLELTDILLRRKKYDTALKTSIMVYEKVKAIPDLADKYVEALLYVKNSAMSCKKYDIAYPYLVEYEKIMLNKFGRNSQEYADALNQKAVATMGTKPDEAKKCLDEAYKILSKCYGEDSQEIIFVLHNKGRLMQLLKDYNASYKLLSKAKELQLKYMGKVVPNTEKYLSEVEYQLSIKL